MLRVCPYVYGVMLETAIPDVEVSVDAFYGNFGVILEQTPIERVIVIVERGKGYRRIAVFENRTARDSSSADSCQTVRAAGAPRASV